MVATSRAAVAAGSASSSKRRLAMTGVSGELQLVEGSEALQDQQVDAARQQRLDLLAEHALRGGPLDRAHRLDRPAQRSHRPGHQDRPPGGVARLHGQARAGAVDVPDPGLQVVLAQAEAVGLERVGLDDVGAGRDVVAVDAADQRGLGEVQLLQAAAGGHAAGEQLGAHRAVQQHGPAGHELGKSIHGPRA